MFTGPIGEIFIVYLTESYVIDHIISKSQSFVDGFKSIEWLSYGDWLFIYEKFIPTIIKVSLIYDSWSIVSGKRYW
jgi:hypothetical protein